MKAAVLDPTIPVYEGFSPAWGQVSAEQLWRQAHADVIKNGMKVSDAIDKAFKRADQIFARISSEWQCQSNGTARVRHDGASGLRRLWSRLASSGRLRRPGAGHDVVQRLQRSPSTPLGISFRVSCP